MGAFFTILRLPLTVLMFVFTTILPMMFSYFGRKIIGMILLIGAVILYQTNQQMAILTGLAGAIVISM